MSICKKCGAEIDWDRNENGRLIPVNAGGHEPHFGVCKQRQLGEWDNYFADYADWRDAPQAHPVSGRLMYSDGAKSAGKSKRIPEHCCPDVPPWDYCEHQLEKKANG